MSVLFPAPFSPSRQWICPGSTTRSMRSLATRDPKRLVMPRSSNFTCGPPAAPLWPRTGPAYASGTISGMQGDEGAPDARRAGATLSRRSRPPGEALGSALGLALRGDLDLAAGDVLRH